MSDLLSKLIVVFHDGQAHAVGDIATDLNISYDEAEQLILKLPTMGIKLIHDPADVYRWHQPMPLMKASIIQQQLKYPLKVEVLTQTPSTNDVLIQNKSTQMAVCLTEYQTQGRGQQGKTWRSPFGQNLTLSLRWPFKGQLNQLSGLSLVMGIALCQALQPMIPGDETIKIKWPNDLLVNHQKLAGILVETQAAQDGQYPVIIGIGLNVNMIELTQNHPTKPWTSLKHLTQKNCDRNDLAAKLIDAIIDHLQIFQQHGLGHWLKDWPHYDALWGLPLTIENAGHTIAGQGQGINDKGHIMIKSADGIEAHASGHISWQT